MSVSGQAFVDYLKQFIGTPYVWGGENPGGFDCSGLLVYGANHFGLDLGGRTTYEQIGKGQAINAKGLRVGDLVFFDTDGGVSGPDHVGIYVGDGKMLHAPRPGKNVEITDMSTGYWMGKFMGGRRVDGVVATGGNSTDFASEKEQRKLTPEELAANYGWSMGFLKSNPELKKKFEQATAETWTAQKFQAEIRNTEWWKTTSDSARQAQVLETTDPATWQAQLDATELQVRLLANEIGAAVPESKLKSIADTVARTGMQEGELRQSLSEFVNFTRDGMLKGEAGMHEYAIKQYAEAQGVQLGDDAIKHQAQLIVKKLATTDDFKLQINEQAKSAYPGYAAQIDGGMTMKDLAQPYQNVMSEVLELPSTSGGLQDPIIKQALNGLDENGKPAGMTLPQFTDILKNDPRWRKTASAQGQVMATASKVLQDMGLMPTRR